MGILVRRRLLWALVLLDIATFIACGARSSLSMGEFDETNPPATRDGGPEVDASADVTTDPPDDIADVVEEGLPVCDPDALYVYLVTQEEVLERYDPSTNVTTPIGTLTCPASGGATPFSMGVDRRGRAYVVYDSGELFLVDVKTATCATTDFAIGQHGFVKFGMGFALDDNMMGESLYVAEISFQAPPIGLGRIDTNTFVLDFIGPFSQTFGDAMEMTSSDDGQLYGYMLDASGMGGHVLRIDKHTAEILQETPLPVGGAATALAFAYWGGDFYIFTSPGGATTVSRYRPSDGSVANVATIDETVVGAGVSTCNPHL
jgi:hypothetical protein